MLIGSNCPDKLYIWFWKQNHCLKPLVLVHMRSVWPLNIPTFSSIWSRAELPYNTPCLIRKKGHNFLADVSTRIPILLHALDLASEHWRKTRLFACLAVIRCVCVTRKATKLATRNSLKTPFHQRFYYVSNCTLKGEIDKLQLDTSRYLLHYCIAANYQCFFLTKNIG